MIIEGTGSHRGYLQLQLLGSARELPDNKVPGVVRFLQRGSVRGREAGEVVVPSVALIANRNKQVILQFDLF